MTPTAQARAGRSAARWASEAELLARRVDGVQFVTYIRVDETDLATRVARSEPITGVLTLAADEVVASGWHAVRARRKLER